MVSVTQDYKEAVLEDIASFKDIYHPVKSSFIERMTIKKLPMSQLHPNPDDEFSIPEIGPNYSIVNRYRKDMERSLQREDKLDLEPLMVEKISTGGYMILNGHHRWMAAKWINIKEMPVQVVNVTHEEDIISAINRTDRNMCISFDLDEVIINHNEKYSNDDPLPFPMNKNFPEQVKKHVGPLTNELHRLGFDIWIYSGSFRSENELRALLKQHGIEFDGIINNMKSKKNNTRISNAFSEKYKIILHADDDGILWVDPKTKEFDNIDLQPGKNWASQISTNIKRKLRADSKETSE